MKKGNCYLFLFLISICPALAQESGVFLKIPVSAKAGAMGDVSVPCMDDVFSMYYNPASISYVKNPSLAYNYHSYIGDINGHSISFIYPLKNLSIGVAYTRFLIGKEPIYDSLGNDTGKSFGFYGEITPITFSYKIGNLSFGFSGKGYKESYEEPTNNEHYDTGAYDLGVVYKLDKLQLGFASENLGGKLLGYPLVKIQRFSAAYVRDRYLLAAEMRKESDDTIFGAGGEYSLVNFLKLRAGFIGRKDFGELTFGLGANLGRFSFDYAFLSYADLGNIHKAGISWTFGKQIGKSKEKEIEKPEPIVKPSVSTKPELFWTGEENYVAEGVSPKQGNNQNIYVFRVKYVDSDNEAVAEGYPKVHINRNNEPIAGSPFVMKYVSGDIKTGAIYSYSTMLEPSPDYTYYFEARDASGNYASGAPSKPSIGPLVNRFETPEISKGQNIAVADFTGKNVSQADASIVSDFLRTELVTIGVFSVMDRNNMETVLAEQKFQASGCTEQQCAVEMGKLLNVQHMVIGSLSKLLETYYITANLIDVQTGKIIVSYNEEASSSRELKQACKILAQKLSRR